MNRLWIKTKFFRKKLNNTSGMSLLFALLAIMIAAMVSAVLVSAALTNAERASRTVEQNQDYLTAESAVKMVRDMFSGYRICFECEETYHTSRRIGEGTLMIDDSVTWSGPESIKLINSAGTQIDAFKMDAITKALYDGVKYSLTNDSYEGESQITIEVDTGEGNREINKAALVLIQDYSSDFSSPSGEPDVTECEFDFEVISRLVNSVGSAADYPNEMKLEATGKCVETGSVIEEGEFKKVSDNTEMRDDTRIIYYEISWDDFLITKMY